MFDPYGLILLLAFSFKETLPPQYMLVDEQKAFLKGVTRFKASTFFYHNLVFYIAKVIYYQGGCKRNNASLLTNTCTTF